MTDSPSKPQVSDRPVPLPNKGRSPWMTIIIGLIVLVIGFLFAAWSQPDDFRISRSILINATPEEIFPRVNNFHAWEDWSPWAKLDPKCKTTFDGPDEGKDASFTWNGNNDVGEGTMVIGESLPHHRIKIKLTFRRPMEANNIALFSFISEGSSTRVSWDMSGKRNFFCKAFCMVMDMDKMVGGDFEKGLDSLKGLVEANRKPADSSAKSTKAESESPQPTPASNEAAPEKEKPTSEEKPEK